MTLYAQAGEPVVCENGHPICVVARNIIVGQRYRPGDETSPLRRHPGVAPRAPSFASRSTERAEPLTEATIMSHVRECQQCGETYVPANGTCPTCEERLLRAVHAANAAESAKWAAARKRIEKEYPMKILNIKEFKTLSMLSAVSSMACLRSLNSPC